MTPRWYDLLAAAAVILLGIVVVSWLFMEVTQ